MILQLISGGQTGADQGALRAAKAAGIPTGGYAPKGFLTEDGFAPWLRTEYGLTELTTGDYPTRTRYNVEVADGCLIFGDLTSPGSKLTIRLCKNNGTPWRHPTNMKQTVDFVRSLGHLPVLMVAGNRESSSPGIGARVEKFMAELLGRLRGGER